jgi:glycerol kinase
MVMQTRDVVAAMNTASGVALHELRVDGGAAAMDLMLQLQADALGVDVVRPSVIESTATGAAMLAGLAEGVWSLDDLSATDNTHDRDDERRFRPRRDNPGGLPSTDTWLRAVERSRAWVRRD